MCLRLRGERATDAMYRTARIMGVVQDESCVSSARANRIARARKADSLVTGAFGAAEWVWERKASYLYFNFGSFGP